MAETRKLLGIAKAQNRYPALNFYCNWALLSELSHSAEAKKIVDIFDRFEGFLTQMQKTPPGQQMLNPDWSWSAELEVQTELKTFKLDFEHFCQSRGINGSLLENERKWFQFLDLYASVVEEVPLVSSAPGLQYVQVVITRRIPISAGMAAEPGKQYFLALQWEWDSPTRLPKRMQRIFAHTLPAGVSQVVEGFEGRAERAN